MNRCRPAPLALALITASWGLTACSSAPSATPTPVTSSLSAPTHATTTTAGTPTRTGPPPAATTGTTAHPAAGLPKGVIAATSLPASAPNNPKLRGNISLGSCRAVAGGWSAAGVATNPGTKTTDYTITIFFTTTSATVIDSAYTKITVTPGEKRQWTVTKQFTAAPAMLCVLRGVG